MSTTYSGPMSLLPELLNAPRRAASGLSGWDESMTGRGENFEATMGNKNTAVPNMVAAMAVFKRFFGARNDMVNDGTNLSA